MRGKRAVNENERWLCDKRELYREASKHYLDLSVKISSESNKSLENLQKIVSSEHLKKG